jgi:D-alanyl-D-alanine dipeptidase
MVRWARRTGREALLTGGYIARHSNHNLGTTVDLTLVRLDSGRALDMGTPYDAFTPRSNTTRARGAVLRNRLRLKNAMEARGFVNYHREWWHYDSVVPGRRRLDVPIGC